MTSRVAGSRSIVLTVVLIVFLLVPAASAAQPDRVFDASLLTGPSPIEDADLEPGGCGWDPFWNEIRPHTGIGHPLEVAQDFESTLAVDPTGSHRMTAVWLQDSGRLVGSATSLDGGRTWSKEIVPEVTTCSGGIHHTSYDSRVVIGATEGGVGRAYVVSTSQNQSFAGKVPDPRAVASHIGVSTKMLDGSQSWTRPVVVDRTHLVDYPVIAADPLRPDRAYVMWTKKGVDATLFSGTHDGGKTWSPPSVVRVTTPGYFALNELIVLPDGSIANMFMEQSIPEPTNNIYLSFSFDQGMTWSDPEFVTSTDGIGSSFSLIQREEELFATWATLAPDGWRAVVGRHGIEGWEQLASFDHAASPAVDLAVMPDGTLGLNWYEARGANDKQGQTETYAVVAHSHDEGRTWESSDLSGPFDASGPIALGDHGSLEGSPCGLVATFTAGPGVTSYGLSDILYGGVDIHIPTTPQGECRSHAGSEE